MSYTIDESKLEILEKEDAQQQQRYKQLMLLLGKSDAYVKVLQKRMSEDALSRKERQEKLKASMLQASQASSSSVSVLPTAPTNSRILRAKTSKEADVTIKKPPIKRQRTVKVVKDTADTTPAPVEDKNPIDPVSEEDLVTVTCGGDSPYSEAEIRNLLLFTGGVLRDYQRNGYQWMRTLFENGLNGILADEMGLGKTVQVIATVCYLLQQRVGGPFLIVAPLSTLPNWASEFARFAPQVPVVLYHGNYTERARLRASLTESTNVTITRTTPPENEWTVSTLPVIITNYDTCISDDTYLRKMNYKMLVVDEGHRLKNFETRLFQLMKGYRTLLKVLLTGTPLQNNITELWSLLHFLLPEIFNNINTLDAWFDLAYLKSSRGQEKLIAREQESAVVASIHQILQPFVLRRLKVDVELELPPKREIVVYAHMTELQKMYYQQAQDRTIALLSNPAYSTSFGNVDVRNIISCDDINNEEEKDLHVGELPSAEIIQGDVNEVTAGDSCQSVKKEQVLKPRKSIRRKHSTFKVANLGELSGEEDWDDEYFEKVAQAASEEERLRALVKKDIRKNIVTIQLRSVFHLFKRILNHPYLINYPLDEAGEYLASEGLITTSGKMIILDKLLTRLKQTNHKVLLFSQMTSILDVLQDYLNYRGWKYCRLDGSFSLDARREQLDWFREEEDMFCFLLTTRAGGLGLNLVSADTAIIFDSDFNPQCDLQAQDRCHRIGQTKPVLIFRLVCANTVDDYIIERASAKRQLERLILHEKKFKSIPAPQAASDTTPGPSRVLAEVINNSASTKEAPPDDEHTEDTKKTGPKYLGGLSREELLEILSRRNHDQDVDADYLTEDDLDKLLDRTELYAEWGRRPK